MTKKLLEPIPPGEILLEEFLKPFGISQNRLGRSVGVPITRINEIINGKRGISVDTAMRLARYFGTSAEFWMNLQQRYDLELGRRELQREIERTVQPLDSPAGA